ncbi:DUF2945 domain-containing protein [Pelagovum pacificum]|uniref:DUF2945 domain-containing protein n=1 Tax=Pelagovum pacificum TaxID=2588711 RepID=A0A5C5GHE0_9RHOB|nr:DUF2945 domain-containing protein [Pelagovum pacificum]QQA42667.1 DUF2945 domain-containing protein [Pelagovum pacificum]TNY34182.1 DUF2945 domain-containing protein [Pelagovum pacificum]
MSYKQGQTVAWKWGDGEGTGKVEKVYTRKITRKINGSEITRNASEGSPAYLIKQDDGDEVLKSDSELRSA